MSDLNAGLLEAVPAPARRILVIGADLLRHRPLWEMRNPLAGIEVDPAAAGQSVEAAILSLDDAGDDPAAVVSQVASCLAPGGTMALFTAAYDKAAAIPKLTALLAERGLPVDRMIGGQAPGAAGILRFQRGPGPAQQLRILGNPFNYDPEPMRQSVVRVRLREPLEQLNSLPGVRCRVGTRHAVPPVDEPEAANFLIFQRFFFSDPAAVMRATGGQNYITVAEVDDEPGRISRASIDHIRNNLTRHHAIQTSSPELAEQLRQFNPEVGVFGNHLPRIRPFRPKTPGPSVRIILAAVNRESGWQEIVQAYRTMVAAYGDRVTTIVVGDQKFFDALQPLNSQFRPTLPYPDYLTELESSDIALLPLSNSTFDRRKTDLKFIECAEAGTVVLASNILYAATVRPGKTGFLYRTVDEFKRHLRTLIEDATGRRALAQAAHRYVCEQRALANHVRRQYEWYLSLVERRAALEQATRERVARLPISA